MDGMGIGSFAWLFRAGIESFYTTLIAQSDTITKFISVSREWIFAAGIVAGFISSARMAGEKDGWAWPRTIIMALIVYYLLEPVTMQPPDRAPVQLTRGQALFADSTLSVYRTFRTVFSEKDEANVSAALVEDVSNRQTAPFAGSDLARLIADYRQFCEPSANDNEVPDEVWQAVGLRGGGGLGVPVAHLNVFSEETFEKAKEALTGWFSQARVAGVFTSAFTGSVRRVRGMAALKEMDGKWPGQRTYDLPTTASWAARFDVDKGPGLTKVDGATDTPANESTGYLDPREVAGGVAAPPHTYPDGMRPPFEPNDCYSAYQAAQAGAEAAYAGLSSTLKPVDVGAGTAVSIPDGINAWSAMMDKSMSTVFNGKDGGIGGVARRAVADVMGAKNEAKRYLALFDLLEELPALVFMIWMAMAVLTIFVPAAIVASMFGGAGLLLQVIKFYAWGLLSLLFMEALLHLYASQMTALQYLMAGQNISMNGVSDDVAGQRGMLAGKLSLLIGFSTAAAGLVFKLHVPPSAAVAPGMLSNAVSKIGSAVLAKATGGTSMALKQAAKAAATTLSNKDNGGDGGGSRGAAGTVEKFNSGGSGSSAGGGKGAKHPSATDNYNAMQRRKNAMSAEAAKKVDVSLTPK